MTERANNTWWFTRRRAFHLLHLDGTADAPRRRFVIGSICIELRGVWFRG